MAKPRSSDTRIANFQRKEVRRTLHNNAWWLEAIADVVTALIDTAYVKSCMRDICRPVPKFDKGGKSPAPSPKGCVRFVHALRPRTVRSVYT